MASIPKVVLILGSGANVGQSVTKAFVAKGYKVASASRSAKEDASSSDVTNITADLSDPGSVAQVFSKVKSSLGTPSVVVYNGTSRYNKAINYHDNWHFAIAASVFPVDGKDPLSLTLADLKSSLDINTLSAYSAAQEARKGFEELPDSSSRTFIYTGNLLNTAVMPALLDLGVGKSATAHIVQAAATAYADRGFKYVKWFPWHLFFLSIFIQPTSLLQPFPKKRTIKWFPNFSFTIRKFVVGSNSSCSSLREMATREFEASSHANVPQILLRRRKKAGWFSSWSCNWWRRTWKIIHWACRAYGTRRMATDIREGGWL